MLITCHDLGRYLGCYGIESVVTPNLDRLASTGVRLTRAFAVAPSCSPSRAALATGRYPHVNGVMGLTHSPFGWDLKPDERHVAQILGDAGYDTHLFGFQHVSPFDRRPGFAHVHTDRYRGLAGPVATGVDALLRDARQSQPLYIEINLEEPHRPYDQGGSRPDESMGVTVPGFLPPGAESRHEMAALQGAVRQADGAVGRILKSLDEAGLAGNTCVVFAADHGIAMPRAKCTLYDPGLEIAGLVRWPEGGVSGGGVVEGLISNVDFLPTLLELAGIPVSAEIEGRSFAPALRGSAFTPRTMVFAEKTYHSYYDPMRAVRTEHFKYIRNFQPAPCVEVPADIAVGEIYKAHVARYTSEPHSPVELYDLRSDPLEQRNLADDAEYRAIGVQMETDLAAWMHETNDPLVTGAIALPGFARDEPSPNEGD